MQNAAGSAAPIGDMMIMVGDAILGPGRGRTFMLCQAVTVFLALIGTNLSCINTGARVTYAMGKDQEAPENFGLLHSRNLTPYRAIWTPDYFCGRRLPDRGGLLRRRRRRHRMPPFKPCRTASGPVPDTPRTIRWQPFPIPF